MVDVKGEEAAVCWLHLFQGLEEFEVLKQNNMQQVLQSWKGED